MLVISEAVKSYIVCSAVEYLVYVDLYFYVTIFIVTGFVSSLPTFAVTSLKEQLPDRVKLYLTEQDGHIVSGALFLVSNNIIQYFLPSSFVACSPWATRRSGP